MWKSLFAATGDLVAWCDADIVDFRSHFVVGLLGPLLTEPAVGFVKGCYERPVDPGDKGGRVTELVARPLLSLLFPQLASIEQPLSGEYAGRRHLLEQLPFVSGYGVDLGLLIDAAARCGLDGIVQVDLGQRRHRNRPLDELSPQALAIMQVALRRAGIDLAEDPARLMRVEPEPLLVESAELPPLAELPAVDLRP
jgi:glucosyl-3-phosphoglycerate synthase